MDVNVISEDPRIIDLDGYAYLIKDKFICFEQDLFDLTDPDVLAGLVDYADMLYREAIRRRVHGMDSVCVLTPSRIGGYNVNQRHVDAFPKSTSDAIRAAQRDFDLVENTEVRHGFDR